MSKHEQWCKYWCCGLNANFKFKYVLVVIYVCLIFQKQWPVNICIFVLNMVEEQERKTQPGRHRSVFIEWLIDWQWWTCLANRLKRLHDLELTHWLCLGLGLFFRGWTAELLAQDSLDPRGWFVEWRSYRRPWIFMMHKLWVQLKGHNLKFA